MKSQASSIESSVGDSKNKDKIWRARSSWITYWFTRWARNLRVETHWILFCLLYDLWNWRISLWIRILIMSGNFVFMIATSAANTWEKFWEADYAFMIDLASRPLPLKRFSLKISTTTLCIFETLTLLMTPLIDFLSISHIYFWCSWD